MNTKTDFSQHNKKELLDICAEFGVDVNATSTKDEIVARIVEDGIDYSLYQSLHPEDNPVESVVEQASVAKPVAVVPTAEPVLIKMTRKNATFEVRGVRFTRENPFALVKDEDVDYLIEVIGGFEVARRTEVEKYYA